LKEAEILEPLLAAVKNALEDKHAYVRRNAVLAIYNIYKNFDYLCPDAPDLVYNFLLSVSIYCARYINGIKEGDASCKRNAFIMLFNCAQDKAVQYLSEVLDQVSSMGEILQFIVVELIRKVVRTNPQERVSISFAISNPF
jgi:coatomer subunit beta